ncbi:SDR family oxidoreductase [Gracilimonas sediminicola]|uniref:SDR family oxidoreductase n=1 Tax=Gracilimonas sediminicola TaxID=2952158 RepID=UPI0038D3BCFC
MNVLVIGANGQIGNRLVDQLKEAGHNPVAMVRKEEQIDQFKEHGVDTVLADLEKDFSHAYQDIDAVVFTAGSGGDTPKSQTKVIDRDGAIKAIDEAEESGAERFIMVSALKANRDPETWSEPMEHYYDAKAKADEHLRDSNLNYTVLMPGQLTNEEGTGNVELKERIDSFDTKSITRDDVASVIVGLLDAEKSFGKSLELLQGDTTIEQEIAELE